MLLWGQVLSSTVIPHNVFCCCVMLYFWNYDMFNHQQCPCVWLIQDRPYHAKNLSISPCHLLYKYLGILRHKILLVAILACRVISRSFQFLSDRLNLGLDGTWYMCVCVHLNSKWEFWHISVSRLNNSQFIWYVDKRAPLALHISFDFRIMTC